MHEQECECEPCNPYVQGVRVQFLQGLFRNIWHCTAGLIICAYLTIKLYWASPEPAAFISGNGVIPSPDGRRPRPQICCSAPSGPHQELLEEHLESSLYSSVYTCRKSHFGLTALRQTKNVTCEYNLNFTFLMQKTAAWKTKIWVFWSLKYILTHIYRLRLTHINTYVLPLNTEVHINTCKQSALRYIALLLIV